MKDQVLIATGFNNQIRIYLSYTKKLVEKARLIHNTEPTSTAALGRLLTALSMMEFMYKDAHFLALKITGDGPLEYLIAESLKKGTVRGTISNPNVYLIYPDSNKLAVGKAIGKGFLTARRQDTKGANYQSSVELVSGEIGDDLALYFHQSEQIPTAVGLGVLTNLDKSVKEAGGFIVQLLPHTSEEVIQALETNLTKITSVTALLEKNLTLEDILSLLTNNNYQILATNKISYYCGCDKNYYQNALLKLNKETLSEFLSDDTTEIVCEYCKKKYLFTKDEIAALINSKK